MTFSIRAALAGSLAAAGLLIAPVAVEAQRAGKTFTLGVLSPNPAPPPEERTVVGQKLRDLGWIPGENLIIHPAFAEGREDRLPELAEMLVRQRVDVIWANAPPSALAAAAATKTIPIVFWGVSFPVELGLVDSLARPGRNVTGMAFSPGPDLIAKQLELLKQIAPTATRVAWIMSPGTGSTQVVIDAAARRLGFELGPHVVRQRQDFDAAFAATMAWRPHGLGLIGNPLTWRERERIVEFANRNRLVSTFGMKDFVQVGGLMSYGADTNETLRQSAVYVDKILRGARPADLPVEQPSKYELTINLKTARALGLTIPPSLLLRADQIIE